MNLTKIMKQVKDEKALCEFLISMYIFKIKNIIYLDTLDDMFQPAESELPSEGARNK